MRGWGFHSLWAGGEITDLEDGDDGPEQRVEVLAVGDGVARLRLQTELTSEDVHPQDTATHGTGGVNPGHGGP